MIRSLKYLTGRDWLRAAISLVFILIQINLDLMLPGYMSEITRIVQQSGMNGSNGILQIGGKMLLTSLGSVVSAVLVGFLTARMAASLGRELRFGLFQKVQNFSMEEINRFSTASLITRSTNDVTQVQMLIAIGLQIMIKSPILAVSALGKISTQSVEWTWLVGAAVLFITVAMIIVIVFAMPKFKKAQELTDHLNLVMREHLIGIKVVRAYNAEEYQEEKFEKASGALAKNSLAATRIMALIMPVINFVMPMVSLGIYWLGSYLIEAAGNLEAKQVLFSNMVVFSSYAMQIISAFMMLIMIFVFMPRASVSAKRINEVLMTKPRIENGTETEGKKGERGTIEVRGVSFKYPNAEESILKDISFTVNRGETAAFIGSTGSGKSTLINLFPRFYDVTEGEILIDGVNVKDYDLHTLNNKIGYVSQKAIIFSGTIRSNIDMGERAGGPITDEDIDEALMISQGTDFVEGLPEKTLSHVAQGGTNLSGGQKQRLAIARAVARKPEILVFDDSFSALDYRTDKLVREALHNHTSDTTNLIVAQRIGTIMEADKIIVLDEGKVVGIGKHEELLKTCKVYLEIAESQLSEEELFHA